MVTLKQRAEDRPKRFLSFIICSKFFFPRRHAQKRARQLTTDLLQTKTQSASNRRPNKTTRESGRRRSAPGSKAICNRRKRNGNRPGRFKHNGLDGFSRD